MASSTRWSPAHSAPRLAGVHHLELPVSDLARSREWYQSRLGYALVQEFREEGRLMGLLMEHPDGGPSFALWRDPERARAAAGFDYFSIGVPDTKSIELLAARLTDLGEEHAGVHVATIGWVLPMLHDPDGHEVRFYAVQHHTRPDVDDVPVIEDPIGTEAQRERDAGRWPVNDVGAQPAARPRTWTWLGSLHRLPSALQCFGWRSPGRW